MVGAIAALVVGLGAGVAQAADNYLIHLDDTLPGDNVAGITYKNGNPVPIQDVTFCCDMINAPYTLWSGATLIASFDNQFNYYDADGVTLSDTVEISGTAGNNFFQVVFISDEANPVALPGGGVNIENGSFQPGVLSGVVSNGDFYNIEIASSDAPEPATWAMMLLGFGGLGAAMRSNRRKQALVA